MEIKALVDHAHAIRMNKVMARLEHLKSQFGIVFPEDEISDLLALDNPGKPHIGNLMVKYGYAETKEIAINQFLNRIRIKSEQLSPLEAISGILASGGIPVLAHPFFGSGDEMITGSNMEDRMVRLLSYGLKGIEAFYSGFSDELQKEALSIADSFDLLVTAGSDYHGKNKMVKIGDTGLRDGAEYPVRLKHFLELAEK